MLPVEYLAELQALDRARWRVAIWLTLAMMAVYFSFILLVAYEKPFLTSVIIPGARALSSLADPLKKTLPP